VKRVAFALLVACSKPAPPPGAIVNTPALDDFRSVEKTTLQTFSDALGRQRANTIDHDVLPPWRDLRARISGATIPDADRAVFATLDRYLAERETSWEAYSAALRSPDDTAAKPHYAKYHEQNAAATADAKQLGEAFRSLSRPPAP